MKIYEVLYIYVYGSKTFSTQTNCICLFRYVKISSSFLKIMLSTIPGRSFNNCCCRSIDV